jgi:endoglycosylceramidase
MVAALALVIGQRSTRAQAEALHADGSYFKDERGAVVILRGLNVAGDAKVPPFRPIDDPALLDPLPAWGVNVARLLFTWEAFEPERGRYDESYFSYYRGVLDALHARGVHAIVDVHQDAFSRFATDGCGEGMPRWAVSSAVTADTPDNGPACAAWGVQFIVDTDTHRCWDDFYSDVQGVRGRYLLLLETLASRLSKHPAVIGYDMLNEPWGNEPRQIGPLYEDGARAIRGYDADALLFVSPQALTSAGQDTQLTRPGFDNFAYAPHYYDGLVITLDTWLGGSLEEPVERMAAQARAWNVPLFVGEFGAPAQTLNGAAYVASFYEALDRRLASGAQWAFVAHWNSERKDGWNQEDLSIIDDERNLRANYSVRPYPARIPGVPTSFTLNAEAERSLSLAWEHSPAQGEARLFAPRTWFAAEVAVETSSDVDCQFEHKALYVRCSAREPGPKRVLLRRCRNDEACLSEARKSAGGKQGAAGCSLPMSAEAGATIHDSWLALVGLASTYGLLRRSRARPS